MADRIIKPHSVKQDQAFFSTHKITACITGIQWGKTTCGAVWMTDRISKHLIRGASFLITAPTYKILEQSTLPAFLQEVSGTGSLSRQRGVFEIECGFEDQNPKVYFRTAKEPDSVIGMTNVFGIWCDEAGKYPLYFWENIQGRASFKDCPIMITTSPYSLNWIYKDLIKPYREGKRKDVLLIQASSGENPYFPKEVLERNKEIMDPRRYNMMYNGNFDKMQGLVYDCFDEAENQSLPIKLPEGTRVYAGVDWGFTEPFVLKVRAVTLTGQHYGISEFYKPGLKPSDVIAHCVAKAQVHEIKQFYCGPDQPGMIEELNMALAKAGVRSGASPADNDVMRGVGRHYELLQTRRLKYWRGENPYTLDEIETYHYPEPKDLGPDDSAKDQNPVKSNDHALDADRYVTIMTYNLTKSLTPRSGEENNSIESNAARIKRLKTKNSQKSYEDWGE